MQKLEGLVYRGIIRSTMGNKRNRYQTGLLFRNRMPNPVLVPNATLAICSRAAALHPGKSEELRFLFFTLPPLECDLFLIPIEFFVDVASPPFHVIDKNADAVNAIVSRKFAPSEGNVRRIRRHNSSHVGRCCAPPGTVAAVARPGERSRSLNDRSKAPSCNTVDEQAE